MNTIKEEWKGCTKCQIGCQATNHVLYETLVATSSRLGEPYRSEVAEFSVDFMIVGEGPGLVEDRIGKPFIGPSGQLLRKSFPLVVEELGLIHPVFLLLTNLVACRPYSKKPWATGNREPSDEEIENCYPRLTQLAESYSPRVLVSVGGLASAWLNQLSTECGAPVVQIVHPSFYLRQGKGEELYKDELKKIFQHLEW